MNTPKTIELTKSVKVTKTKEDNNIEVSRKDQSASPMGTMPDQDELEMRRKSAEIGETGGIEEEKSPDMTPC